MPKKRAISMKFSPPMILFPNRIATDVPYAICMHTCNLSKSRALCVHH
jgi:hypothetical protein